MALDLGVIGVMNAQFAIQDNEVYVLEVNPRASRTVPFVSKAIGFPLAKIAARCMVGISLAVVGVAQMATYASVGPIVERLGERRTLLTGLAGAAVGFALFGWPSGAVFLAAIPINALWSLAGSTSQSLMTQHVSAKEQGELQGALASLRGVAMLIGPGLFSLTFAYFISPGHVVPGAPWYLASALLIISLAIAWAVAKDKRSDKDKNDNEDKVNKGLAPVEAS